MIISNKLFHLVFQLRGGGGGDFKGGGGAPRGGGGGGGVFRGGEGIP